MSFNKFWKHLLHFSPPNIFRLLMLFIISMRIYYFYFTNETGLVRHYPLWKEVFKVLNFFPSTKLDIILDEIQKPWSKNIKSLKLLRSTCFCSILLVIHDHWNATLLRWLCKHYHQVSHASVIGFMSQFLPLHSVIGWFPLSMQILSICVISI